MKYILVFLTVLVTDCAGTNDIVDQKVEKTTLEKLSKEIKAMANASVCSEDSACAFIGFGSKPCGGNWGYLVYSNSIDVADFLTKVKTYNALEKKYNIEYGIISDCSIVSPPQGLSCKNGKCIAVNN
ncbi:MAG: hypothetical protein L3J34_10495 [Flavobacteriaceae bacterium]|nr:hypothetical protein [Flavobacteriaceae bacterium]